MFSFGLQDGFYALGIAEADRDYFTVDIRDDFLLFLASMEQALHLRQRLASLLDALGLQRNPTKGFLGALPIRGAPGVDIDSGSGMFYAPADKLDRLCSRFFLRELHSVVGDRWGGRVPMTPQLRRVLHWWTSVPGQSNGKPIHRPVWTAYLHTGRSGYGRGGVLNGMLEARGFWSSADER
eukprot:jgi/Tetstr1/438237/TSEL_002889.t1